MIFMGKDKALSIDGISDIITKGNTWLKTGCKWTGNDEENLSDMEKQTYKANVGWNLA